MTTANPWISVGATILFILLNVIVISRGVVSGIEKMSKFMMPALFILFIVLIIRSLTLPGAMEGVAFSYDPILVTLQHKRFLLRLVRPSFHSVWGFR